MKLTSFHLCSLLLTFQVTSPWPGRSIVFVSLSLGFESWPDLFFQYQGN